MMDPPSVSGCHPTHKWAPIHSIVPIELLRHRWHGHSISSSSAYLVRRKCQEILDPLLMVGGKTSTTGYPTSIHFESFWRIQLKITNHKTNKREHSAKWNFPDWTQIT
jgi:hypothetical protein